MKSNYFVSAIKNNIAFISLGSQIVGIAFNASGWSIGDMVYRDEFNDLFPLVVNHCN